MNLTLSLIAALIQGSSTGLTPLTDFSIGQTYKGQNGGLYGNNSNAVPPKHLQNALAESAQIRPLAPNGTPSADGKIVLISIGMSNTTQEFSVFRQRANADPAKNPKVVIVDCAQGGMTARDWANSERPWDVLLQRLAAAGVTPAQVQCAWVKLAQRQPTQIGEFPVHAVSLQKDTQYVLNLFRKHCRNARIVFLGSRIYAGYATTTLNPEPYAYESAFAMRWIIEAQISGDQDLNWNPNLGNASAPLVLWGPYLWADGVKGRQIDNLVWLREDFQADGTHPSPSGREKVATLLLSFFKTDPTARTWFLANP